MRETAYKREQEFSFGYAESEVPFVIQIKISNKQLEMSLELRGEVPLELKIRGHQQIYNGAAYITK